jgi:hypothetical protein
MNTLPSNPLPTTKIDFPVSLMIKSFPAADRCRPIAATC